MHLGPKAKTTASCGARLPNFRVVGRRAPPGRDTGRPPRAVPRPRKAPPRPGLLAQPIAEFLPAHVRRVGRFGWERRARGVCGVGVEARHRPRDRVAEAKGAVSRRPAFRHGAQVSSARPGGGSGDAGGTAERRLVRPARPPGTRGRRARGAQPPGPHAEASSPRPEAPHPARPRSVSRGPARQGRSLVPLWAQPLARGADGLSADPGRITGSGAWGVRGRPAALHPTGCPER